MPVSQAQLEIPILNETLRDEGPGIGTDEKGGEKYMPGKQGRSEGEYHIQLTITILIFLLKKS